MYTSRLAFRAHQKSTLSIWNTSALLCSRKITQHTPAHCGSQRAERHGGERCARVSVYDGTITENIWYSYTYTWTMLVPSTGWQCPDQPKARPCEVHVLNVALRTYAVRRLFCVCSNWMGEPSHMHVRLAHVNTSIGMFTVLYSSQQAHGYEHTCSGHPHCVVF